MALRSVLPALVLGCLAAAAVPGRLAAQAIPDTTRAGVGVRLAFPDQLRPLVVPGAALMLPRGVFGAAEVQRRFAAGLDDRLAAAALLRQRERLLTRLYAGDSLAIDLGLDAAVQPRTDRGLFGLNSAVVDLAFDGQLALEMVTERLENLRCTGYELQDPQSGCQPRFSAPRIDNTLQLQVRGVIGQRLFVDVDLNTERDYTNANTIRAFYQGLEDEVLQRVDVGTVQFRAPGSRFLTAGIPVNNFGVSAQVEYGPLSVQGLVATQKGSVVAERTYRVGAETVEPQDRLVRDLDYEMGRFYWVVDPTTLPGYPRVDPLTLDGMQLPANVRPAEVRVYRYRAVEAGQGSNPNLGGISALAYNDEGTASQQVGPLRWELLTKGEHYWVDPSGLWLVLSARLDPNDFLAVSYVTQDGSRVGTFPAADNAAVTDSLLLLVEPNRDARAGTFRHAMRNVYRVAGSDLTRASLEAAVLLNRAERPDGDVSTWLARFGLAIPTDQATFDIDNRLFPRVRDPGAGETVRDNFIIFPHLEPFGDPELVTDVAARNDSLYRTPEYLLFNEGPPSKFQLRLEYLASGGGDRGSLSLNAQQIRDGTEQIFVDGRRLVRGIDYSISYETGLVSFLDPEALFGSRAATVNARFEQRGFFAVAPTSIFGLTARWRLGDIGGINFVGLYQAEKTAFRRPPLGFEPTAGLIAGVSTDLEFDLPGVSRFLNGLVKGPMTARSSLDLDAELAFSRPDLNRSGEAYLEEFEDDQSLPLSLSENAWRYSSRPRSALGAEAYGFAAGFDSTDAVQLTWQNLIPDGRGGARELRPTDIDTNIVIRGGATVGAETVMYLTFHADTAGGIVAFNNSAGWSQPRRDFAPRWRSIVTPLSNTGRDLTRSEALEFWVFESADRPISSNGMRMLVDLGSVSEDALTLAPEAFTVNGRDTTWTGRQYPGVGQLDTERSPTGIFNAATDDNGILADRPAVLTPGGLVDSVATCRRALSNVVPVYPWGDLSSRCSAGNGALDTEDLDGDLLLDARGDDEDLFRYVVDLNDPKYRVRTGVQTIDPNDSTRVAGWTLYRIPLREVDYTIGQPNLRLIKQLRITLITPPDNGEADPVVRFALARMRLLGAPWIVRAAAPIEGLDGSTALPLGEVAVTSISTENIELGYESPPGLGNSINEIGSSTEGLGVQVNEKSLRTIARGLRPGTRAEAYHRLTGGSQSLLAYREMRVWVRGRGEGWDDQRLRAFVKVGTDDRNFYYYEAPAVTTQWRPEMVVDLEHWRALRAEVETRFLRGEAPSGAEECGGDPEAWVACDNGYVVHVRDPGIKPPNLAAVQEVATGIRYVDPNGAVIGETELWTDDIRLAQPISDVGVAMAASARLIAGDVGIATLGFVNQDGNFRQIGQAPSYRDSRTLTGASTVQLGRFFSSALGLVMPLSMSFTRSAVDPELITGTDVRGEALSGLRRPRSTAASFQISASRIRTDGPYLVRTLVNPLRFSANWSSAGAVTEYSDAENQTWGATLRWDKQLGGRPIPLGLGGVVSKLPRWIAGTDAGRGIANGRFNPIPSQFTVQSQLTHSAGNVIAFTVPIERLADTVLLPTRSLQHLWRNSSVVRWQPLAMLNLNADWQSTRDLRVYADSTPLGRLAGESRRELLGFDVGTERDRNIGTSVALVPRISSWIRPRFTTSSNFTLSRSLTARNPVRVDGDTAGAFILPQTLNNSRRNDIGLTLEPAILMRRVFGDSAFLARIFQRVRPIDASWGRTFTSTYDLASFDPGAGYQLAIGGLDDFLEQEGVRAVGAAEIHTGQVTGTFDLPAGFSGDLRYGRTAADRYQRSALQRFVPTRTEQLDWPEINLRWSRSFRGGPLTLLSFTGGVRQREARTETFAADSTQPSALVSNISTGWRPGMMIYFRNGVTLNANATLDRGESINNGNVTERESDRYDATLAWSVRLPWGNRQTAKPLRTSLFATSFRQRECLLRTGETECAPILDVRRTEASATMRTDIVGELVNAAFTLQYVLSEYRHIDRATSTISANLRFEMPLSTFGDF